MGKNHIKQEKDDDETHKYSLQDSEENIANKVPFIINYWFNTEKKSLIVFVL